VRSFVDELGKRWVINIRVSAIERVRGECAVDLMRLLTEQEYSKAMMEDVAKQAAIITAVCRPQLDAEKMSDEQFKDLLHGQHLEDAMDALVRSIIDFFPNRQQAKGLMLALDRAQALMQQKLDQAMQQLEAAPMRLGDSSTSVPESSESTRANGPFASLPSPLTPENRESGTEPPG
jgi:hypothetical protein